MMDFFAGDLHEITEKVAYEHWERRAVRSARLKLIGLRRKRLWPHALGIRNKTFPCIAFRWRHNGGSYRR
jgi:hypothetical protein